jgi:hypothetical protein
MFQLFFFASLLPALTIRSSSSSYLLRTGESDPRFGAAHWNYSSWKKYAIF